MERSNEDADGRLKLNDPFPPDGDLDGRVQRGERHPGQRPRLRAAARIHPPLLERLSHHLSLVIFVPCSPRPPINPF